MTTTAPAPARGGRSARSLRTRRALTGWAFVAPFVAVLVVALVAPIAYATYLSFFRDPLVGGIRFVGVGNFVDAFLDERLWASLGRVGTFVVVQVPLQLVLATLAALALDSERVRGQRLLKVVIFTPFAVPGVIAALMWGYMYGDRFGLVANLNDLFNVQLPSPLSSDLIMPSIGNILVWEIVGYNMILLYAALRTIPRELYEAAELDGAGAWRIVSAIKLPSIRPTLVVLAVFSLIANMQLFGEPQILRASAPNEIGTDFTPNLYTYSIAFLGGDANYAAAVAIVVGVFTIVAARLVQRLDGGRS